MFIMEYTEVGIKLDDFITKAFDNRDQVILFIADQSTTSDDFAVSSIVSYERGTLKGYNVVYNGRLDLLPIIPENPDIKEPEKEPVEYPLPDVEETTPESEPEPESPLPFDPTLDPEFQ